MSEELIELTVEEIMRMYHMKNYNEYNDEELREQYRQVLRKGDVKWPLPKLTKN